MPTGVEEVVGVVVAVVGYLKEHSAEEKELRWRKSINASLERIEGKVDFLIRAVKELLVEIDENLSLRLLSDNDARFQTARIRLERILLDNPHLNRENRREIEELAKDPRDGLIDAITHFSLERDPARHPYFAGFPIAIHGFCTLVVLTTSIKMESTGIRVAGRTLVNSLLRPCNNPAESGSFGARLQAERARMADLVATLDRLGNNRTWIVGAGSHGGRVGRDGFERGEEHTYFIATFSGSPDAGYSYGEITEVPQSDTYSRHPGVPKIGPNPEHAAYAIVTELNTIASDYRGSKGRANELQVIVDGIAKAIDSITKLTA